MSVLTAFNNHFIEFLEDVSSIFPDDKDIKKTKTSLELLKKTNPRIIIQVWKQQIANVYREKIELGDISFFLNKDYSADIDGVGESSKIMSSIERLRGPVSNMGVENQEKTMKYIQNLTKLSDLYGL